jgi:hypothetical protein
LLTGIGVATVYWLTRNAQQEEEQVVHTQKHELDIKPSVSSTIDPTENEEDSCPASDTVVVEVTRDEPVDVEISYTRPVDAVFLSSDVVPENTAGTDGLSANSNESCKSTPPDASDIIAWVRIRWWFFPAVGLAAAAFPAFYLVRWAFNMPKAEQQHGTRSKREGARPFRRGNAGRADKGPGQNPNIVFGHQENVHGDKFVEHNWGDKFNGNKIIGHKASKR